MGNNGGYAPDLIFAFVRSDAQRTHYHRVSSCMLSITETCTVPALAVLYTQTARRYSLAFHKDTPKCLMYICVSFLGGYSLLTGLVLCAAADQNARQRRCAPIPRPNSKYNQHPDRTPHPIKDYIRIPRTARHIATQRLAAAANTSAPTLVTAYPTSISKAEQLEKLRAAAHLSVGRSASRVHDAKYTRTRYGATDKTL